MYISIITVLIALVAVVIPYTTTTTVFASGVTPDLSEEEKESGFYTEDGL